MSGFRGVYAYRGLVKSLRARADELPLATTLLQQVSDLRATRRRLRERAVERGTCPSQHVGPWLIDEQFQHAVRCTVRQTLDEYRAQLQTDESDERIGDTRNRSTGRRRDSSLPGSDRVCSTAARQWGIDEVKHERLKRRLEQLQTLAAELPSHLHRRLGVLAGEVRTQYRSLIALLGRSPRSRPRRSWRCSSACSIAGCSSRCACSSQARGEVAAGEFDHRIQLASRRRNGELAEAMNDMTARFQEIRDDLDRQVQRAHEASRPQRATGQRRLSGRRRGPRDQQPAGLDRHVQRIARRPAARPARRAPATAQADDATSSATTCEMIQNEAFRCKEITEKLLDFSRLGDVAAARHRPARAGRRA